MSFSGGGGIVSTLTGGVQNLSAFLPLLGTEQCSHHVSSALKRGYLYAAATPMSIFGSLGVVTAGFKTLLACFSFRGFEGAKLLGKMGFEPLGENLSLIMVEPGEEKNTWCYIIETQIEKLIKERNIDKNRIAGVSHKSTVWNVKMVTMTAILCVFSIAPYILLNLSPNLLDKSTRWIFPVLRATGGFITVTFIQLLLQRRITTLSEKYLVKQVQQHNPLVDEEAAKKRQIVGRHLAPTWLLLFLLFIGLVASVVGYVGSFSVVQNSISITGCVSWFGLETGLSILRLSIWASNPTDNDAPPLEIILKLEKYEHKPLPTCNKSNQEIFYSRVLPLTRARDFLKTITSFAGLIEPFNNAGLSLYYTLTRKRRSKESDKLGEQVLYITVFDHKERTTRVYTQDGEADTFYSTKSDAPLFDVGHYLLEVEIGAEIDPKGDPISSDSDILDPLRNHHRSILEHIRYRIGAGNVTQSYVMENSWTMKVEDTLSAVQMLKKDNEYNWNSVVAKGKKEELKEESSLIHDYFTHESIERERQKLDEERGEWITRRMEMITEEAKERFEGKMGVEYRVNKQAVEKKPATTPDDLEMILSSEHYLMELLLVCEVGLWEQLFWNKFRALLVQIGDGREEEKERLKREWKANCWKRLNPQMHAAEKRLDEVFTSDLVDTWASSIGRILQGNVLVGIEELNWTKLFELSNMRIEQLNDETDLIRLRMENEIEDTVYRLKLGTTGNPERFEFKFDQFWDDETLFQCRYSRSKWLYFNEGISDVPLETYLHVLKGNKNITHINFDGNVSDSWVLDIIRYLPWVTSISRGSSHGDSIDLPAIERDPLFIKSTDNDLNTFAKKIRPKLDSSSTYIFTDAGYSDMDLFNEKLGINARVLISFFPPASGQRLTLRLKHSGEDDGPLEITLGSIKIELNHSSKSSLTIDDITLDPIGLRSFSKSDHLFFVPGIRNDIFIEFGRKLGRRRILDDIELLDEDGREYMPYSPLSTV